MGNFNKDMLRLARDSRGMSQVELASRAGLTQGFISKVEAGEKDISPEKLAAISTALGYPESFFCQPGEYQGVGLSLVFFRKRASTSVSQVRAIQAEVALRRLHLRVLLRSIDMKGTGRSFQFMDIDDYDGDAERVAQLVRASWTLPLGPIANLVAAIESAGGIVFKFSFGTKDIDAVSQWPDDLPPLFFINADAPADRVRFSLAHELGHVVMHRAATEGMESEADRFAAEFLMPAKEIAPQLNHMSLDRAATLKPYWRVSMAALIRRARDLGRIDGARCSSLYRRLSQLGMRTREPSPIAPEGPRLLDQVLQGYMEAHDYGPREAAGSLHVSEKEFADRYLQRDAKLRLTM
jgi:Zn-dependent peptidase ImmA (M78 family)/DNA-binding XRE family transcriptional regulator